MARIGNSVSVSGDVSVSGKLHGEEQASQPGDAILLDSNNLAPSSVFQITGSVTNGKLRININGAESGDIPLPDEAPSEFKLNTRISVNIPFKFENTGVSYHYPSLASRFETRRLGIQDLTSTYQIFVPQNNTLVSNAVILSLDDTDPVGTLVRILPETVEQICHWIQDNTFFTIGGNNPAIIGFNLVFAEGYSSTLILLFTDSPTTRPYRRKLMVISPDGSLYTVITGGADQTLTISSINVITVRTV